MPYRVMKNKFDRTIVELSRPRKSKAKHTRAKARARKAMIRRWWENLDEMMLSLIFSFLEIKEFIRSRSTCHGWIELIVLRDDVFVSSCNDVALNQISNSTICIGKLHISDCYDVSNKGINQIIKMSRIEKLILNGCDKISNKCFVDIAKLPNLRDLEISKCINIKSDDMQHIEELINLEKLKLDDITDECFVNIAKLPNLRDLEISKCINIKDDDMPHIGKLVNLEKLKLGNITGKCFVNIAKLINLQELSLSNCKNIIGTHMYHIGRLIKLIKLDISICYFITGESLSYIKDMNIEHLDISFSNVDDVGVYHISRIQSLRTLIMRGTTITSVGFAHIGEHKNLEELNISWSELTELPYKLPDSLQILRANNNNLTVLPNNFPDSLQELWVHTHHNTNQLRVLPDKLPASLKKLYANYDQLVSPGSSDYGADVYVPHDETKKRILYVTKRRTYNVDYCLKIYFDFYQVRRNKKDKVIKSMKTIKKATVRRNNENYKKSNNHNYRNHNHHR